MGLVRDFFSGVKKGAKIRILGDPAEEQKLVSQVAKLRPKKIGKLEKVSIRGQTGYVRWGPSNDPFTIVEGPLFISAPGPMGYQVLVGTARLKPKKYQNIFVTDVKIGGLRPYISNLKNKSEANKVAKKLGQGAFY